MRPADLPDLVGQEQLVGPGKPLARAIESDQLPSSVLWGPPGSGKTTLARIVARRTRAHFVPYSAVLGTVPELRGILEEAREARTMQRRRTILFIDEIHRFHKGQQDAFLPYVEDGTVTLIGATTENPSFAVNAALLSRCRVFRLERLGEQALSDLLARAMRDPVHGYGRGGVEVDNEALAAIARVAEGDARRALSTLEMVIHHLRSAGSTRLTAETVADACGHRPLLYDKTGDEHHNVVSALIKSMRGSDPDAAIYWAMRMLEAGDDPLFVLRRLMIFASEDVGNADPRALQVAVAADQAFRRMGMPEGLYPIAQAVLYLASAPKSNGVGRAFAAAREDVRAHGALPVPMKLRNAATKLMAEFGYGAGYRYPHDEPAHHAAGESYLPDELGQRRYYEPSTEGLERAIRERLDRLRKGASDS
ncbi:MAG: replication-associated recombination protein A [Polyangiaceae bacterium]|nr:replication-associated recombination protein A [Polyangiaceae bacterium]